MSFALVDSDGQWMPIKRLFEDLLANRRPCYFD